MLLLSDARIENHHFITAFLEGLSESEKQDFKEGEFHIDSTHSFYVKNNIVFNEIIIHSKLTELAMKERVGGILLLFGWSISSTIKDEQPSYNLFMELSEGLVHSSKSRIEVIDSLLWMHKHNYVHQDIYNNNIFKLGTDYVIGDFDRSIHTADILMKFQDLTHFYAWLPKAKIGLFKHLLVTALNGGRQVEFIQCEDKLIGILEKNLQVQKTLKEKFKDPVSQLDADKNIAMYQQTLDECNAILESPVLTRKKYKEFVNAMIDISLLENMPTMKSRTMKSRTMKSRTMKSKSKRRNTA